MEWISEDPTYLAGGLALVAGAFLVALRLTQQGKYLIYGLGALGLSAAVVLVEWVWVTDNERIERSVYGLAKAVAASDVPGTLSFLTDDVQYVRGGTSMRGRDTRALAESLVSNAHFDFLKLTRLEAHAGGQSRRGTAEFRVLCGGSFQQGAIQYNFGSMHSTWSLGFVEKDGVWKVNRITPVELPRGENVLPR